MGASTRASLETLRSQLASVDASAELVSGVCSVGRAIAQQALVRAGTVEQLQQNLKWFSHPIPDQFWADLKAKGLLRGIGYSSYIEACGIAPSNLVGQLGARAGLYDAATVRVNATGSISVMVGAHSHGQGHETAFPQVVSDMLGVEASSIDIVHGDTSKIPFGMGTYGSRSLAVCGSAVVRATEKIIVKAKKIAAHIPIAIAAITTRLLTLLRHRFLQAITINIFSVFII